jgi:hypothetical protein
LQVGLWLNRIRRGLNRSPQELKRRLFQETRTLLDRYRVSPTYGVDDGRFVRWFGVETVEDLWLQLSDRPYPTITGPVDSAALDAAIPGERIRVIELAERALALEVDLLGSGPETLSRPILWDTDFKVEEDWPMKFFRDIDILNPERNSDVKVPWELSRLQWLIPVGQAYMLTGDEKYARFAREVLADWIEANPYGRGVNWAVAMEAAMRVFSWTWLFHVFKSSTSWDGYDFRAVFLRTLFEHAIFCERYIEDYGVNGNHCTADAGALVFAGLFFGVGKKPKRWQTSGWQMLNREMSHQVLDDGTDFEGSVAYHRFVAEMFFWPARYRRACGEEVSSTYQQRLLLMAAFTESYTKPDGSAPLWGDADDGRVLPFGGQGINDHRYLPDLLSNEWSTIENANNNSEFFWVYGYHSGPPTEGKISVSKCFEKSGFFIMASEQDHVFIDCGPVGLGGKGGHGHNDCLSFEATLAGVPLISDSGTYVYTASYEQRDEFRATLAHNTPMIDGVEQNRFVSDEELFSLQYDAKPVVRSWSTSADTDVFVGTHSGYQKLDQPVFPVRKIILEKATHRLFIQDSFDGEGTHSIRIPLHFSPGCQILELGPTNWLLKIQNQEFNLICSDTVDWTASIRTGWVSPSYGVKIENNVIEFSHEGALTILAIGLYPAEQAPDDPQRWLKEYQ